MNTSNPFQIPSCLQRADVEQRRRERFRRGVVVAIAAVVALLVVLLIEGCVTEHARTTATAVTPLVSGAPASAPVIFASKALKPAETVPASVAAQPAAAPADATSAPAPKTAAVVVASRPGVVYVVKAGDTLSRIAKLNHTSIKALKAVNGLASDVIGVGEKLKLPAV